MASVSDSSVTAPPLAGHKDIPIDLTEWLDSTDDRCIVVQLPTRTIIDVTGETREHVMKRLLAELMRPRKPRIPAKRKLVFPDPPTSPQPPSSPPSSADSEDDGEPPRKKQRVGDM